MLNPRRAALATVLSVAAAGVPLVRPATAAEPAQPVWETVDDGGELADAFGRLAVSSRVVNVNAPETLVVAGDAGKPAVLEALGVDDVDVVASAVDAGTGATAWSTRYDGGLGVDDHAVALENSTNNNLVYLTASSGGDAVVLTHPMKTFSDDTTFTEIVRSPGTTANDSAISPAGGFMGIVGSQAGQFYVRSFGTGSGDRDKGFVDTAVTGEAFSADVVAHDNAPIDVVRTMVVTGRGGVFGNTGDLYTAAYNYRTFEKLWERTWAGPAGLRDEGVVATAAWSRRESLWPGRGIAFVAGRTLSPKAPLGHEWDIVVTAYDLVTGTPLWTSTGDDGVRRFTGEDGGDDVPVAVEYSDATGTVYVTGVSDRPPPHGDDVVVLAFDALTGEERAVAYASGGAGNGTDVPTGLAVSPDGERVVVSAEVDDIGGRAAALFAFDAGLRPAGEARLAGGAGGGPARAAGAFVSLDGERALLAGATDQGGLTGYDHHAAAFPVEAFVVETIPTTLAFTAASPASGQYTDDATLEVELSSPDGPVAGQPVTIGLAGRSETVTTGDDGRARATFPLDQEPGQYEATAEFAGVDPLLPSSATAPFTVEREDTALTLTVDGRGSKRTLTARLADADTTASGIGGREIVFTADGTEIGRATTGPDGVATLDAPPGYRGADHAFAARFDGDPFFLPSLT